MAYNCESKKLKYGYKKVLKKRCYVNLKKFFFLLLDFYRLLAVSIKVSIWSGQRTNNYWVPNTYLREINIGDEKNIYKSCCSLWISKIFGIFVITIIIFKLFEIFVTLTALADLLLPQYVIKNYYQTPYVGYITQARNIVSVSLHYITQISEPWSRHVVLCVINFFNKGVFEQNSPLNLGAVYRD